MATLPMDEQKRIWREICQTLCVFLAQREIPDIVHGAPRRINNKAISEPFHEPVPWKGPSVFTPEQ